MEVLKHRANDIDFTKQDFGLEIDVRDFNDNLVISHDHPTEKSILLSDYLTNVKEDTLLAINVKSTEIEKELKNILNEFNIERYFTFDWPIPALIKAQNNDLTCAFRLSEFEKDIFSSCEWVWIDCFNSIWYDEKVLFSLKEKFKIAIVSPELHNRKSEMEKVKEILSKVEVNAICTDEPEFWIK